MKKTMLLVAMVAVVGMMLGGCASSQLKAARDNAEIGRLREEVRALQRANERGITLNGPGFDAILSGSGHDRLLERVIPEMIGEEAAKAELYRMKTAAIKKAVFSEGAVSRNSTKLHFWFDETGQEFVRGYIKNMTPNQRIVDLRIVGTDIILSDDVLEPGESSENIWAKAGTRVCVTGRAVDISNGKFIGNVYYNMPLHFSGANPVAKIGAVYYQWRIIFEGG